MKKLSYRTLDVLEKALSTRIGKVLDISLTIGLFWCIGELFK